MKLYEYNWKLDNGTFDIPVNVHTDNRMIFIVYDNNKELILHDSTISFHTNSIFISGYIVNDNDTKTCKNVYNKFSSRKKIIKKNKKI